MKADYRSGLLLLFVVRPCLPRRSRPSARPAFSYNAAGNRSSLTQNAQTQTYTYASNTNKLHQISGARDLEFTFNNLGALTLQSEYLAGGTWLYAGAIYAPSGLLYGKFDFSQVGEQVTRGDTVVFHISPSGEMMGKANLGYVPRLFAYDLAGNLLEEAVPSDLYNSSNEPIIDHIYLGGHRLASITGRGNVCIIATVAFGSPLAKQLDIFRAFRDRVLLRITPGRAFVTWYYAKGPIAAEWLKSHERSKLLVRATLVATAFPLKAILFGGWPLILLCVLCVFVVLLLSRYRGWRWTRALAVSFGVAFIFVIFYSYFIEVPKAMASYAELDKYYYTEDHIGRPFSLRDDSRVLRWYENHYAFGELISEQTPNGAMYAGGGSYQITWKPNFRFPGQYEDTDQGIAYNNTSFIVQNHLRDYLPEMGRYNRKDPIKSRGSIYMYSKNNPIIYVDIFGLAAYKGSCRYISGGVAGGVGLMRCEVSGSCSNDHNRQEGTLWAFFAGGTFGLPIGYTHFDLDQSDDLPGAGDISNLEGYDYLVSISGALGHPTANGGGATIYTLSFGNTFSQNEFGRLQAGGQSGFDASADLFFGSSWLSNVETKSCNAPGEFDENMPTWMTWGF